MVSERELTIRVTLLPRDTNAGGTIFGGVILSHIDLAGGIAAQRNAVKRFVTRAIREVDDRKIGRGCPGTVTRDLQRSFFDVIKGKDKKYSGWLTYL